MKGLGLSDAEVESFKKAPFIGVPFNRLKSLLDLTPHDQEKQTTYGIPVDSTNNEMTDWMKACFDVFEGRKMNLLLKGDNDSKYPAFQGVIQAFKKNDFLKFQMVTNPEAVPPGSELYKVNMAKAAAGGK